MTQPPDAPTHADGQNPQRWLALGVCLAGVFMTLLDVSIVNVALPSLESGLKASASDLQWVLSGYAVAFGLALVPSGRLGDALSRRTVFLVGLSGFVLASLACGIATTPLFLIVARLVQGLFAGVLTPQVTGIIQDLFRGPERGRAFGYLGAIAGISTAVGPLLGGLLIALFGTEHGWRYVFFVNIPIGAVVIPVSARLLKQVGNNARAPGSRARLQLDPVGSVLLGAGVVSILLPLVEQREWSASVRYPLFAVAAAFLVAFVLWERRVLRRGRQPVVNLHLFAVRTYSFGSAIAAIYFAAFTSIFFVLTVYLQQGTGYSAWQAGLTITAFAVAGIPASRLSGSRSSTHAVAFVRTGAALFAVGLVGVIVAVRLRDGSGIGWWLVLPLAIAGFGNGLVLPANQTSAVSEVPVAQASAAGGAYQTFQRVGTALGIAVVGSVFFSRLADTRGDYGSALERGVELSVVFALATVVLAVVEDLVHTRATARAEAVGSPTGDDRADGTPEYDGASVVAASPAGEPGGPSHGRHNAEHPEDVGAGPR